MLSQRILSQIFKNGCYLMCLMRIGHRSLDEIENFVASGWVTTEGFVVEPQRIARCNAVTKVFEGFVKIGGNVVVTAVDDDSHFVILKDGIYKVGQQIDSSVIAYNSSDRFDPHYVISSFRVFS